jgi:hypothetical protein
MNRVDSILLYVHPIFCHSTYHLKLLLLNVVLFLLATLLESCLALAVFGHSVLGSSYCDGFFLYYLDTPWCSTVATIHCYMDRVDIILFIYSSHFLPFHLPLLTVELTFSAESVCRAVCAIHFPEIVLDIG